MIETRLRGLSGTAVATCQDPVSGLSVSAGRGGEASLTEHSDSSPVEVHTAPERFVFQ